MVAVCSAAPHEVAWARANQDYIDFGITAYDNYEGMLEHRGLQAVWISTSTDVHASQTVKAVEKGLHVLCEKPLSTNLEEVSTLRRVQKPWGDIPRPPSGRSCSLDRAWY